MPLLALTILAVLAAIVLLARDPRRFVAGFCAAAVLAFLVLYPNLSALLMPDNLVSVYNGFLPTWLYGFQFSVNHAAGGLACRPPARSGLLLAGLRRRGMALVIAYAAWTRRIVERLSPPPARRRGPRGAARTETASEAG